MAEATLLVSQAEAGRLLGVSRTTLWRLARNEEITKVVLGRRAFITRQSLYELIERKSIPFDPMPPG